MKNTREKYSTYNLIHSIMGSVPESNETKTLEKLLLKNIDDIYRQLEDKAVGSRHHGLTDKAFDMLSTHTIAPKESTELSLINNLSKPVNNIIVGENLHALDLLTKSHKEQVDIVYVKSPSLVDTDDFKHNGEYVSTKDSYAPDVLSFNMEKRLNKCRELMSREGVVYIYATKNEIDYLRPICDKIFTSENKIAELPVQVRGKLDTIKPRIYTVNDIILVYAKNKKEFKITGNKKNKLKYKYDDKDGKGPYRLASLTSGKAPFGDYTIPHPTIEDLEIKAPKNSSYSISKATSVERFNEGLLVFKYSENKDVWTVRCKRYLSDEVELENSISTLDFINNKNYYTNEGRNSLYKVFDKGIIYRNPQSVDLLKKLVSIHPNKNAVILDLFAGSGALGQAVMELNIDSEFKGDRKFILLSDNTVLPKVELHYLLSEGYIEKENELKEFKNSVEYRKLKNSDIFEQMGVARSLVFERVKRISNGYSVSRTKKVEANPHNIKYIDLVSIPNKRVSREGWIQKEQAFFNENVLDIMDPMLFKGVSDSKVVYLINSDDVARIKKELRENPTNKETIIYSDRATINLFSATSYSKLFKRLP